MEEESDAAFVGKEGRREGRREKGREGGREGGRTTHVGIQTGSEGMGEENNAAFVVKSF